MLGWKLFPKIKTTLLENINFCHWVLSSEKTHAAIVGVHTASAIAEK